MPTLTNPFTQADSQRAYDDWGANCGPNALAFALGLHIDQVRPLLKGFDEKRYTNPSMIWEALQLAGVKVRSVRLPKRKPNHWPDIEPMFSTLTALVRIQWEGPWTEPGARPKWAYRQTHWVATWEHEKTAFIFDVNGGVRNLQSWESEIVPLLTSQIDRANGHWFPTHVWRILK